MFSNPQPPPLPHPRVSEAPLEFRWLFGGANMQCDAADMHCATVQICDWLTIVKQIYELSCLLIHRSNMLLVVADTAFGAANLRAFRSFLVKFENISIREALKKNCKF